MTSLDTAKYQPTIDAILSVADLEQVSVKKIRRALQELFSVDFEEYRQEINAFILERYQDLMDKREDQKQKREAKDALLAAKLQREDNGARRVRASTISSGKITKPKKKKSTSAEPRATALTTTKLRMSSKLCDMLNTTEDLPRPQIVKKIWEYIKSNDLQDPNDKRQIICDDKMAAVFGKRVGAFEMNRVLSSHVSKLDDE